MMPRFLLSLAGHVGVLARPGNAGLDMFFLYFLHVEFLMEYLSFLSTGGTSTGEPVCLFVLDKKKSKNRFGDYYLTLRYFLRPVVSG